MPVEDQELMFLCDGLDGTFQLCRLYPKDIHPANKGKFHVQFVIVEIHIKVHRHYCVTARATGEEEKSERKRIERDSRA